MNEERKQFDAYFKDCLIKFITVHWGERCPEHEERCPTCQAWDNFDTLMEKTNAPEPAYEYKVRVLKVNDLEELEKLSALGWHVCAATVIPDTMNDMNTLFYFRRKL